MVGTVYIVGAGPGDPELITLKGLKCIQKADVILYDRLVNEELLKYASEDAILIYCGKKPNEHSMRQETINHFLVKFGKRGDQVVRLKGGDPFVFGRGGEEAQACVAQRIPFEIIPGVTSGIGASSYAGIPLTHRGLSKSFAFVTGHSVGDIPATHKWNYLAQAVDTLCIYMGVAHLTAIIEELLKHGKEKSTPIALIQWGTTTKQRTVVGTLETIREQVRLSKLSNPCMIIIGDVVRLRDELNWFQDELVELLPALEG